jgi:hypothetical protein
MKGTREPSNKPEGSRGCSLSALGSLGGSKSVTPLKTAEKEIVDWAALLLSS